MQQLVPLCKTYDHQYDQGHCIYCGKLYKPPELKRMLPKVEAMIEELNGLQEKVEGSMWLDLTFIIDSLENMKHALEVNIHRIDG